MTINDTSSIFEEKTFIAVLQKYDFGYKKVQISTLDAEFSLACFEIMSGVK